MVGEGWKGAVWPVRGGVEDLRGGAVWSVERRRSRMDRVPVGAA